MKALRTARLALVTLLIALLFAACQGDIVKPPVDPLPPLPTEFPNENDENVLISPEGQAIIDAVLSGRIEAPELITGPLEILPDDSLQTLGTVPSEVQHPFWSSMDRFWLHRANRNPSYAVWSTDYCSFSPDSGWSFNFVKSCTRHDYGYRNWKKYGAFTYSAKLSIDNRFLQDMKNHCAGRVPYKQPTCYTTAYTYYGMVRKFG